MSCLCGGVGGEHVLPADAVAGRRPPSTAARGRRARPASRLVVGQRPMRDEAVRGVRDATDLVRLGRRALDARRRRLRELEGTL